MAKASMLVVEDNPMSRATAIEMFEDLGFTVYDAYNGHHALALLQARPEIAVMFIDVRMPGMSGPELAEAVMHGVPTLSSYSPRAMLRRKLYPTEFRSFQSPGAWIRSQEQSV